MEKEEALVKHHVVTKASDDTTFQTGDHILIYPDGSIGCLEAQGWIEAVDVKEATKGMLSEVSSTSVIAYIEKLETKVLKLKEGLE